MLLQGNQSFCQRIKPSTYEQLARKLALALLRSDPIDAIDAIDGEDKK